MDPTKKLQSIDGMRMGPRMRKARQPSQPTLHSPTPAPEPTPEPTRIQPANNPEFIKSRAAEPRQGGSLLNMNLQGELPRQMGLNKKVPKIKRHRKRSVKKIALFSVFTLIIAAVLFGGWDAWQLYHKLNKLTVGNLTASVGGAENILVAGSTNRCNLKVQNAQWGFCAPTALTPQGVTGVNSDIIFVVHLVPSTHTVSLLSIPRDTFIPNARSGNEAFKIDAALYEGPTQLVSAVEQDFGIPIQHYAEVGFDGFVNIVNAVGGIKMEFPEPVYDSESYLNITTPGCKELNGVEALQVVRARHLQYKPATITTNDHYYWPQEPTSDIARITRTHEFLRVLASSVTAKGVSNPITDQKLIDAIAPQVQVDSGFSTSTMLDLAQEFHAVNINNVPQYTLPVSTTDFGSYIYEGGNYGDVTFPSDPTDQSTIDSFLGIKSSVSTTTGKPLPLPSSVDVNVINGSAIADQASQISTSLQALGFSMVGAPTTTTPVSDQAEETIVYYSGASTEPDAQEVATQLSGSVILSENPKMVTTGSSVTLLTGNDLSVNTPASTAPSTPSAPTTTTTSTATTSTASANAASAGLAQASTAIQPLSPWDPRACTTGQPVMPY